METRASGYRPPHQLLFGRCGQSDLRQFELSEKPMASSVEIFDAGTLEPLYSHSPGVRDAGSLTWVDCIPGGWIAGFAHYDGPNGTGYKDHSASSVVTFDDVWRRTGGWAFPEGVAARMAPHAASAGAIGPDGLLYLLGHDRPELCVLARPQLGPGLVLVAVIDIEAEGQAFSWAPDCASQIFCHRPTSQPRIGDRSANRGHREHPFCWRVSLEVVGLLLARTSFSRFWLRRVPR